MPVTEPPPRESTHPLIQTPSHNPTHTAPTPSTRLRAMFPIASVNSPRRARSTVSSPKAENVVNPPNIPARMNSRVECGITPASVPPWLSNAVESVKPWGNARATSIPAAAHPITFTTSVPQGNRAPTFPVSTNPTTNPTTYRSIDPSAPPSPTSAMLVNSFTLNLSHTNRCASNPTQTVAPPHIFASYR